MFVKSELKSNINQVNLTLVVDFPFHVDLSVDVGF